MPSRLAPRARDRGLFRHRLTAILSLALLPLAALAGLATTDLALQTRASPPTMGALEASDGSAPTTPPDPPPTATAPAAPTGLVVARFIQ